MPARQHRPIDPRAIELATGHVLRGEPAKVARRLLEGICDPTRLNIIRALRPGPLAASDLAHVLGRTRSATSQHLRVLREAGVVDADRRGSVIRYRLASGTAADVLTEVADAFDLVRAA